MPTELYILMVYCLCVVLMLVTQSALSVKEHGVRPLVGSRDGLTCLSPLELCQYILAKGVRKHGSKALF